jgi:hypothetical protein
MVGTIPLIQQVSTSAPPAPGAPHVAVSEERSPLANHAARLVALAASLCSYAPLLRCSLTSAAAHMARLASDDSLRGLHSSLRQSTARAVGALVFS